MIHVFELPDWNQLQGTRVASGHNGDIERVECIYREMAYGRRDLRKTHANYLLPRYRMGERRALADQSRERLHGSGIFSHLHGLRFGFKINAWWRWQHQIVILAKTS